MPEPLKIFDLVSLGRKRGQKSFVCTFRLTTFTGNILTKRLFEHFKSQILILNVFRMNSYLNRKVQNKIMFSNNFYRHLENEQRPNIENPSYVSLAK